jgi:hypothetical protein
MTEEATQVAYSVDKREVTITFRDGTHVVLPLRDALHLSDQLSVLRRFDR